MLADNSTRKASSVVTYITVNQAAEALAVNQLTIRRLIDRGELPAIYVGRAIRIPADALQNLPAA